jgi:hypothetical protein
VLYVTAPYGSTVRSAQAMRRLEPTGLLPLAIGVAGAPASRTQIRKDLEGRTIATDGDLGSRVTDQRLFLAAQQKKQDPENSEHPPTGRCQH